MNELMQYPVMAGIITFLTSVTFIFLRTLNVKYVSSDNLTGALLSGLGVGSAWLVSTAIGVSAILTLEVFPIIGHLCGGLVGTYIAMKKRKRK